MIDITVDIRGQELVRQASKILRNKFSEVATVRKITRPGVAPITAAIQALTPVLKKGTKHYYTYKGQRKATFLKGHVKEGTRDISTVKSGYRRFPTFYIGPIYTRKAGSGGTFSGKGKDVDAYYAHMIYGGAAAYERRVIQAGFKIAQQSAAEKMTAAAVKVIEKEGQKAGFRT